MARAREIPIAAGEPFAAAAARVVRARAEELFELSVNVLDTDDIERVHDMRVATRRLRAVLEIFAVCFPRNQHKECLRDVRRLADALGERRDPDVHIEALEREKKRAPTEHHAGFDLLIAEWRARQQRGNEVLQVELRLVHDSQLEGRLYALAASPTA